MINTVQAATSAYFLFSYRCVWDYVVTYFSKCLRHCRSRFCAEWTTTTTRSMTPTACTTPTKISTTEVSANCRKTSLWSHHRAHSSRTDSAIQECTLSCTARTATRGSTWMVCNATFSLWDWFAWFTVGPKAACDWFSWFICECCL